jgi:hypothetical protein
MQSGRNSTDIDGVATEDVAPFCAILTAGQVAHPYQPSAAQFGRHAHGRFFILFIWLTIRRQNDRIGAALMFA